MKRCSHCKKLKPYSEFWKDAQTTDTYRYTCISCCKTRMGSYLQRNKSRIAQSKAEWAKKNSSGRAVKERNRKAMKKERGVHTLKEIEGLLSYQGNLCAYCNAPLDIYHVDHVIPLVSGGINTVDNLVVACPRCNLSKGSKNYKTWIKEQGLNLIEFEARFYNRVLETG